MEEFNKLCKTYSDIVSLFIGKDILSTDFGIAILIDNSWITDSGTYNASTGEFNSKKEVDEDYIGNVNQLVNNRVNISGLNDDAYPAELVIDRALFRIDLNGGTSLCMSQQDFKREITN